MKIVVFSHSLDPSSSCVLRLLRREPFPDAWPRSDSGPPAGIGQPDASLESLQTTSISAKIFAVVPKASRIVRCAILH